jgi:hypothetical protein
MYDNAAENRLYLRQRRLSTRLGRLRWIVSKERLWTDLLSWRRKYSG